MRGVQRARFCHNRKDPEATYLPIDDTLYRLKDGGACSSRLDLCGFGIHDADMSAVATVRWDKERGWRNGGGFSGLYESHRWW